MDKTHELEYELDSRQCAEVALYMHDEWKKNMKTPHFVYYNFETWLKKIIEHEGEQ